MSTAAVIINPKSGRGRGKGLALAEALRNKNQATTTVLENFGQLVPALQQAARDGAQTIYISSGDGTVQFIQTWLAEHSGLATMPRLCLLPHGTTNMTAADLGFGRGSIAEQAAFIESPSPRELRRRHTLRVANPDAAGALHGMFLGTGAIAEATLYCQRVFNERGIGGNLAPFATLASVISKTVFRKPNPEDPHRFDRPYGITLASGGQNLAAGQQVLLLATTLDKLILNARPFFGGAHAPLRTTTVSYPLPNPVRWLLPTLYGGEDRRPPPGISSHALQAFEVQSPTAYVLDGEFFRGPANAPLRVETGQLFEYIRS